MTPAEQLQQMNDELAKIDEEMLALEQQQRTLRQGRASLLVDHYNEIYPKEDLEC